MMKDQIFNKMKDLTFHTVVNKVLLGALPIDSSELTRENAIAISTYSLKALESAGGFGLLEKAIENTKDPIKKNFLNTIHDVCIESAKDVVNRIAMEDTDDIVVTTREIDPGDTKSTDSENTSNTEDSGADPSLDDKDMKDDPVNSDTSIDDIKAPDDSKPVPIKPEVIRQGIPFQKLVADAKMTDAEYGRFVDRMGKLDIPEVSKMINERVETAMKAEKETYRMIDESDQKLRDAITDKAEDEGESLTDDQAEEIKESMLLVPLKNSTRDHISLISKLQTAAIESIQISNTTDFDKVDPDMLLNITENYTIPGIFSHTEPTLTQIFEGALNRVKFEAANECVCPQQAVVLGTALATIVYTLLQTMHSMNLIHITPMMVKQCCHGITPCEDRRPVHLNDYDVRVRSALEKQCRRINKMRYAPDVESAIDELNNIRNKVYTARDYGYKVSDETVEAIENAISRALTKKNEIECALESTLVDNKSSYGHSRRYFETDVANMNRLTRTFANKPVDAIEFRCTEGADIINVIGIKDGHNVVNTSFALESSIDVPTAKYIKRLVGLSNIKDIEFGGSIPTITTYIDGNRTRIN